MIRDGPNGQLVKFNLIPPVLLSINYKTINMCCIIAVLFVWNN